MIKFILVLALATSLIGVLNSLIKDNDPTFAISFIVMILLIIVECIKHNKNDDGDH